jgi:hypothetical protein
VPALEGCPPYNEDGGSSLHVYTPWWRYKEQLARKMDFARGYHIEVFGGRTMPDGRTLTSLTGITAGKYGRALKREARRYYGTFVGMAGRGEMIPNADCYCDLDPDVVDCWGIPVLRFHWKWSPHELRQAAHMHATFTEILAAMGGRPVTPVHSDGAKAIQRPGEIIHEVGVARMGADKRTSVLNGWCQSWEVKNLFVVDGAAFASNPDKNPTLTILALAFRAADHLMAEMKRRSL